MVWSGSSLSCHLPPTNLILKKKNFLYYSSFECFSIKFVQISLCYHYYDYLCPAWKTSNCKLVLITNIFVVCEVVRKYLCCSSPGGKFQIVGKFGVQNQNKIIWKSPFSNNFLSTELKRSSVELQM